MKTQKTLLTLAIGTILIPFVAQAAWWNPLSWFDSSETDTIIEMPVSPSESENEQTIAEDKSTPIETDTENAQPYDKTVSPTSSPSNDSEINALKKEIQELRSAVQSTPTTNTVSTPIQPTNSNPAINEQVLETLRNLEQRVGTLESKTKDQDYEKVLARIESLEDKSPSQSDDQSSRIKDIIGRVNLLSSAGIIDGCGNAGDQCWRPMICDAGNIASDKSGSYYESSVTCKDLSDLKY